MALTDFTVIIPVSVPLDEHRTAAVRYVQDWLRAQFQWPIMLAGIPAEEPWSKGRAVHGAVEQCSTAGLIIHDGDVYVHGADLAASALAVTCGHPWAQPHHMVYRLSRVGTQAVYSGALHGPDHWVSGRHMERRPHVGPPGGGIVVCSRAAWDETGGIDPRFIGWGGEDISWARALETLCGPAHRGNAPMWHLWHPPQEMLPGRRGSLPTEALASRYLDAVGNVKQMAEVVRR